jgi:hypothetical protein
MVPYVINSAGLIAAACYVSSNFPDLLESVIPECFYPSISLGTVRFSNRRESRRDRNWTPDPFDVAEGRGKHSRTTIKTFGGDALRINSPLVF